MRLPSWGMGWCRRPDWAASDAVQPISKAGATQRALVTELLLESRMELIAIGLILVLSIAFGLAGARGLLAFIVFLIGASHSTPRAPRAADTRSTLRSATSC